MADAFADERAQQTAADSARRREELREVLARALPAQTPRTALWTAFRETYQEHTQVLALSSPAGDGSRTLLVTEPPPETTLGDVLLGAKEVLLGHEVRTHRLGYDGWVRDVALSVKGSEQEIAAALSRLNRLLFHTSYKAYVLPLPAQRTHVTYDLNLDVTAAELQAWVHDSGTRFTRVEGGAALGAGDLFEQKMSAVYTAGPAALVGWWLPRGTNVDSCAIQARQFAMDADLVIGAVSDYRGTLVLGRERIVPVEVLPPLRFETIRLLARANRGPDGELAQSYERNHRFAGRVDARNDWAPIYLSPELIDTEYGSLLNITDQLLKSWSNNGTTRYVNFRYPDPARWPFPNPLYAHLNTESVTYNWNTRGAAYSVAIGGQSVLALGQAGALPVSYFPEGQGVRSAVEVQQAEDAAYRYFGEVSDANLARVVQYAALYQIFSAFTTPAGNPEPFTEAEREISPLLTAMLDSLENEIHNTSDAQLDRIAQGLATQRGTIAQRESEFYRDLIAIRNGTASFEVDEESARNIRAASLADLQRFAGRQAPVLLAEDQEILRAELGRVRAGLPPENPGLREQTLSALAGLRQVPQRYAQAMARRSDAWIHTPAVVLSTSADGQYIGGHNLGARVTRVRTSETVAPGRVEITAEGDLLVHPAYAQQAPQLVWKAARAGDEPPTLLAQRLSSELGTSAPLAPRTTTLGLRVPPGGPPQRFTLSWPAPGSARGVGWFRQPGRSAGRRRPASGAQLLVERQGSSYFIEDGSTSYQAFTIEDATDVLVHLSRRGTGGNDPLQLELRGFAHHEAKALTRSAQVRATGEGTPREISALVGADEAVLAQARARRLDFSRAEVTASDVVQTAAGQERTISIRVPGADAGAAPATASIRLGFRNSMSRSLIDLITTRVRALVNEIILELGAAIDWVRFNLRLNAELKHLSRELGVEIHVDQQFQTGARDLYIADASRVMEGNDGRAGTLLAE
ncbi:MAG TPA: hypothetical protein VHG08_20125 [Longimicrobium sp.]|nr:hypothetical protein [Longimicrobium sp.]